MVKNPLARQELQEMWVRSLSQGDPLEEGMATHSRDGTQVSCISGRFFTI